MFTWITLLACAVCIFGCELQAETSSANTAEPSLAVVSSPEWASPAEEERDELWASTAETEFNVMLEGVEQAHLVTADCRTTECRFEVRVDEPAQVEIQRQLDQLTLRSTSFGDSYEIEVVPEEGSTTAHFLIRFPRKGRTI